MSRSWILLLATVALAAAGAGYWWRAGPISVGVATTSRGAAVDAIYATGTVEPTVMLPVAPRSAGRLVTLDADEGHAVRRGAVLARLDAGDLEGTVVELAARARYAHSTFDRQRMLVERGVAAASELDRTRADAEAADAALQRAEAQRDFMQLRAPADGLVIRRDGEVGQFIPAGQAVFYLSCCAPLRVTADVDEEDIPRVHVGQRVVLRADALPGSSLDGEVSDITPKGDPVARSYRVRIRIADPSLLRVGMTVDANLIVAIREHALLVPTSAVQNGAVWLVQDGRLVRRPVHTGVGGAATTEVLDGLADGAVMVAVPPEGLQAGRRARGRPVKAQAGGAR